MPCAHVRACVRMCECGSVRVRECGVWVSVECGVCVSVECACVRETALDTIRNASYPKRIEKCTGVFPLFFPSNSLPPSLLFCYRALRIRGLCASERRGHEGPRGHQCAA